MMSKMRKIGLGLYGRKAVDIIRAMQQANEDKCLGCGPHAAAHCFINQATDGEVQAMMFFADPFKLKQMSGFISRVLNRLNGWRRDEWKKHLDEKVTYAYRRYDITDVRDFIDGNVEATVREIRCVCEKLLGHHFLSKRNVALLGEDALREITGRPSNPINEAARAEVFKKIDDVKKRINELHDDFEDKRQIAVESLNADFAARYEEAGKSLTAEVGALIQELNGLGYEDASLSVNMRLPKLGSFLT